jgi:hypothetical protein
MKKLIFLARFVPYFLCRNLTRKFPFNISATAINIQIAMAFANKASKLEPTSKFISSRSVSVKLSGEAAGEKAPEAYCQYVEELFSRERNPRALQHAAKE